MKRIITTLVLGMTALGTQAADGKFLQLSLTPDIALHSRDTTIKGISLNIWGENPQSGFTMGFVNGSTGESCGFTMGLANYSESYTGVQFGFVNISKEHYKGWQDGFVNIAKEFRGLQTGVVNYTETLHGVQFGLVNIVKENPWFTEFPNKLAKGFVFVNWSF
jgi:hypothetical protein